MFFHVGFYFFISPFGCLSTCFCLLCRSAVSPDLGKLASHSKCLVELSVAVSLIKEARCSINALYVAVGF